MKKLSLALAISVGLVACKTAEKTTATNKQGQTQNAAAGNFLKGFILPTQVVKPSFVNDVAQADMPKRINALGPLVYHNAPATTPNVKGCVESAIAAHKAVASKDRFSFDLPVTDITACLNKEYAPKNTADVQIVVNKATVQVQLRATCDGSDVSLFNAKSGSEFLGTFNQQFCMSGDKIATLINIEYKQNVTIRAGGAMFTSNSFTLSGMMDDKGEACVATRKSDVWTFAPCKKFEILSASDIKATPATQPVPPGLMAGEYYIGTFDGLTGATRGRYYAGGSINLDFNNWQGQLVYSDADSAPTWTMSSPGKGSVNGTFVPYTSAGLRLHRLVDTTSVDFSELLPRFSGVWF